MIKKVHFLQLFLLMLLLFILFQITSISINFDEFKSSFQIDKNSNSVDVASNSDSVRSSQGTVFLITGKNNNKASHIEQELKYLQRGYQVHESLLTLSEEDLKNAEIIILASSMMKDTYDLETVKDYMSKGIHVIMATMPEEDELDQEWRSFLGISTMNETFTQVGISIFSDFFLGDKYDYKELELEIKNIKVSSISKTYIAGLDSEKESGPNYEEMSDILWRNVNEGSQIYVVNAPFFQSDTGIGIISAIFAQIYQDYIYPVINARALLIHNAPYLSIENDEEMKKRYARNSQRFLEDIILPNIIALAMSTGNVPTFYGVTSFSKGSVKESELNTTILPIIDSELKRIGGEIGISTYDRYDTYSKQKITNALELYKEKLKNYDINSLNINSNALVDSLDDLTTIHSLVSSWDEGNSFSYYDGDTVNIPVITEGYVYSDEDLFKLHSTVTALGIISHGIDMSQIIYPENDSEDWSKAFDHFSSAVNTYWDGYRYIDGLNISGVSSRVSRFLDMKPTITTLENSIKISIENFDKEAYFMLRTEKKVIGIDKGTVKKVHDNAYLVKVIDEHAEITLQD